MDGHLVRIALFPGQAQLIAWIKATIKKTSDLRITHNMSILSYIYSRNKYENLEVQDLRMVLHLRGVEVTGKKKTELEAEFEELHRGITNVPELLHNIPDTPLGGLVPTAL